jgi:hypothetical protein
MIVVADDTSFVEHRGNAGRPHAVGSWLISSMRHPLGWSRSFVLAALRALHLDQRLRAGAFSNESLRLDSGVHTGNVAGATGATYGIARISGLHARYLHPRRRFR